MNDFKHILPRLFLVQVENENHCDFTKLREMLIRTNMEDLRDTTHGKHYELYRKDRLKEMGFTDNEGKPGKILLHFFEIIFSCLFTKKNYVKSLFVYFFIGNFAEQYNMRRENHLSSLQQKEEEMRQKFVIRVKEKEAELKEAEKEVRISRKKVP